MINEDRKKLYDALSSEYDLGTYEEFERNIGDSVKRKKLYDVASADYDLGDFESYSQRIGPTHKESLDAFTAEHGSWLNDFEARDSAETKKMVASSRSGLYMPSENAISGEERERYMELHKQEEALKKAWFTSDEYLAQKDADALFLSNVQKDLSRQRVEYAQANPPIKQEGLFQINPYAVRGVEADTELERFATASRLMDDAIKMHNAPSRYDDKNVFLKFGKGAGDVLSDADFWTAGLTEIADNLGVRDVLSTVQEKLGNLNDLSEEAIENILSPAEKAVLQAWAINTQEQLKRKDDLSRAYQAGQGATESLGFMAEFALTGGIGKAATEGVEQMVKWLGKKALTKVGGMTDDVAAKVLKETGEKIAQSTVGKYGVGLAESLAEAAGRTGVMPSTFRNISEKATEIETDENGNNYLVRMNDAFASGLADSFIETLSEGGRVNALGTLFGDVAGKIPAYKKMVDKFSHTKASELWDAFNSSGVMNTLRAGGWHGLGEEYLEEWYGNALRTLTGVDKEALKDFATVDNQIVTLTSFLPMTIFGGTVSTAQVLSANKDLEKKAAALKSALMERGYDEAQANNMIDMMRGAAPAEVSETLTPIVNAVANRNTNEAAALMKPVGEFAAAVQRWQSFNTKYNYQEQEQRDGLRAQMEENLGQFWQQDENGRQTVQRGVNEKGEVVYMLGKPSVEDVEAGVTSEVAAVTSDGRKVFVNPSEYQLEDELEMNTFLGNEIMAEKGNREQARMIEEKEAKIAAIRETAVPGTAVNIGTAEAPMQAIVLQRNPDGVIVNTPDGQTRQMTYEEFGNYVGVNAVPMTDAQIDEHEADVLTADRAQREAALDQEYENEDAALEELSEAEDEIEQAVDTNTPLPMKADGSVDQTALWNNDPERWAQWNDEQRQDRGANSLAYVSGAIAKEQAKIAELQAAYAAESDFDARDAIEKEIADTQARVERLTAIQQGYVAQTEAAAAPVAETQPSSTLTARMASEMTQQELNDLDESYDIILSQTRVPEEKARLLQEYLDRIAEGSTPIKVLTRDNYEDVMRVAGCPEADIAAVGVAMANLPKGQAIAGFASGGKIFAMADSMPTIEEARITYVHERQHLINSADRVSLLRMVSLLGTHERALEVLKLFVGEDGVLEYKHKTIVGLADEIIARCMEIAYTTEEFSVDLQSKGLSDSVISIIEEINNGQRNNKSLSAARRSAYAGISQQGNNKEESGDSGQVSGGVLGEQRYRSSRLSQEGAGDGSTGEGAEVISEEQLNAPNSGEAQQITAADGEVLADTDGKGGVRFSIRTWNEGGRDYLAAWLANDTTLTEEEKADIIARMDEFYKNALLYSDTYAPFGTWSDAGVRYDNNGNPLMSVIKANCDYAMNLDFSLVCKKRRPLNRLLRTLVNRNAFATYTLRERELAEINWILQEHGFEVACALCFVDSKRYRVTGVADVFALLYNRLVKALAPKGVKVSHFNYNDNPNVEVVENGLDTLPEDQINWAEFDRLVSGLKPNSVEYKIAQYLREHPEARKLVDATDFIEAEGFESVKENNPDLLKFYNMKKGAGGPKASFGDVQYLNDILKKEKSFDAEKAYAVGGVRLQSFSDFVPHMYFDYMQLFAELAVKKLPLHAYTKEVLFAKIFGLTGAKINMSLVPAVVEGGIAPGLDAEGNYAWADPVIDAEGNVIQQGQSFPYDEAMAIQQAEGYSKNCGVIAVGISDAHIEKMLDDPNIPFIIPYHKSSLNAIVARMTNIDQYKDYTKVQSTRKTSGSKLDKGTKDFNFNEYLHGLGESGTPQQAAQAYLNWCRENNYKPKFSQFAYHPNYYKLLQDFNTIDLATGEYAPQGAVTMTFPTEESAFGNVETLIQQGLQEDAELEEKMEQEIDGIADQVLARLEEISKESKMSDKQRVKKMAELADERMAKIKEQSGVIDLVEEAKKAVAREDAKDDVSFRITPEQDKTYMDAVEAGDMETAQKMVLEAAKLAMPNTKVVDENGNPKVVYHGSTAMFTVFDKSRIESATGTADGRGFYFTTDRDYALGYKTSDGQLFEVFLNIEKPLSYDKKTITKAQLRKILKEADRVEYEQEGELYMLSNYANYNDVGVDAAVNEAANLEYDYADNDVELVGSLIGGSGSFDLIMDAVKKVTGKSGMIAPKDNGTIHYVVTDPSGIKSAEPVTYDNDGNVIPLSERFNPKNEDIRFRIANENQAIFVSNAAKAVEGIKQEKATPEQWLKMIEKNGGLKAGEDKWMGLSDWLKASDKKTLTKQEVLDFINENMIVIEETHYAADAESDAENTYAMIERILQEKFGNYIAEYYEQNNGEDDGLYGGDSYEYAMDKLREEMNDEFPYTIERSNSVVYLTFPYEETDDLQEWADKLGIKFAPQNPINYTRLDYTTDGLSNKHEIALSVPTIESWNEGDEIHFGDAGGGRAVAWIRFGDTWEQRPSPQTSRKVLVIDEIQSKRHQEGREKGYMPNLEKEYEQKEVIFLDAQDAYINYLKETYNVSLGTASQSEIESLRAKDAKLQDLWEVMQDANGDLKDVGRRQALQLSDARSVPDAPFDKNWHELAMKRMLRYAAENGYDAIAWTKGEQQADRYNLGKIYNEIEREDNPNIEGRTFSFSGGNYDKVTVNEDGVVVDSTIEEAKGKSLSDLVGKDLAVKMMSLENYDTIDEEGLRIGGEGMKGFYDRMLPAFMNKYGKKWGVKVEDIELPNLENGLTMHSIPVTEEMKASVMEGQVMFRMRTEEEDAMEFTQQAINDCTSRYNEVAEVKVFPVNEETAERFGYTMEEMQEIGGTYLKDEDIIAIFALQSIKDSRIFENIFFHESIHKLAEFYPEFNKIGEWIWNNADVVGLQKIKDNVKTAYEQEWHHEEMLAYGIANAMSLGRVEQIESGIPEEYKGGFRQILNEIGYEPEKESRRDESRVSESIRRGAATMERKTDESGRSKKEEARTGELTAEERRVIGEYFPEFNKEDNSKGNVSFRTSLELDEEFGDAWRNQQDEMDAISATAIVRGNYLKAPNGADTNLTPEQWAMVRTKNFLNWFGDWINDPENASKVVDENGEPKVVYHQTNSVVYINRETGENWDELDWRARQEWDERDDWDEYWEEQDFNTFSRVNARTTNEFDGFFFAPNYDEYHEYGDRTIPAFLNIKSPASREDYNIDSSKNDAGREERIRLQNEGFDGVIRMEGEEVDEYIAFSPNQIKSATENTGEFSTEDKDIRYRVMSDVNTNPTEAQKKAGNYKMGHIRLDGYNITIENPKGSVRRGTDSKGNAWENTLNNDYGYIRGTEGVDGDHIDVYLSDNPTEGNVFVIDQVNPETREFDEHKVMYGFNSAEEAREAYLANFSEGWNGLGTITEVSKDEFKKWIESSHRKTKPFSEYKSVKTIEVQSEGEDMEDDILPSTGTPTDEVVANGLQLTPAQTAEVAANIFAALPEESRKKITEGLNGNILGLKDAILQIPTSLATKENWNDQDRTMADIVAEEMTKMAGEMTRPFSAEEGLWLLYNNLNTGTDLISQASRALVQRNLGFDSETLAKQEQAKEDVRFRTVGDASSNAEASLYNRGAANVWTRLKESYVDMNASVEELVKAIEKRTGKVAQGFENILLALNQQSSKGLAAMESYTQKFLNPMFDEIRRIMDETKMKYEDVVRYVILKHGLERNKKLAQREARAHYQEIYDDIISKITGMTAAQKRTYLTNAQLKEGDAKAELARLKAIDQSIFSAEDKQNFKKEIQKAAKAVAEAEEHLKRAQKIASLSEQEAQDELDKIFEKIENGTDSVFKEMRENDYSGISSMFYDQLGVDRKNFSTEEQYQAALMEAKKDRYSSLKDIEAAAEAEVKSFEGKTDTKELWKRINAATKETLRQQYEANMISKDQYLNLRDMFEYYVPLRGFKDNTAEDMYTYYRKPNSTGYTKPILGAEGRKTEAESPFGWIAAMAGSAIASNVKNEAKLALYYFVSNRPENGIATISKTWFVDSGEVDERGKKIFKPAYPPFSEDLSSAEGKAQYEIWQANMKELQKKGQAYEAGQRLNLGNAVVNISDANKPEHVVNVKVGGKDYTIIINGNPRAAQAINGDLNIEGTAQDYSALFGPVLRWMSSVNTSYNPEFWITNMMRDMAFTWMAVNIKEDPAYRRRFSKNYRKAFKVISLVAKNEKGTIGDSYLEQQYKDFVKYGGVTGYTQIKDSETWEQEIENYLSSSDPESLKSGKVMRGMKSAFHAAHRFGESLEQVSRFAAFLTARETGKSINEAINDAKEITVNFNRKGSGKMITLEEAKYLTGKNGQPLTKPQQWMVVGLSSIAPLGRRFIMFFNAAIQGLNATYKLMKKNPKRFTGWALGYAAVGMMNAVLHAILDDDDDYLDIPQYERRNSLMIGGNGAYFKWALPQEARAFYALGDLAVETVMGRNPHQNFLGEALKIGTEILPVNPSEGWKAFMPSVAIPFIELALNEDYKGAPIYNEQKWLSEEEKERTAKWSSAYQGTGWTYVKIAQGLNFITGGDKHDAGLINLQPEKLEHLVQSAFGGTIRTADKFINTISAALDPEEPMTIRQTPFLNRFLTINDERFKNVHVNDVFDYYKADAEHALTLEKQYIKDRDMDSLTELRSSDEYQWAKIYGKYKKPLKAIQDKIKVADGTAEKKELMKQQDELKKRMIKEISEL